MADVAALGFQVDTRSIKEANKELKKMPSAAAAAEKSAKGLGQGASSAARKVANDNQKAAKSVKQLGGAFDAAKVKVVAFAAVAATAFAAVNVVQNFAEFEKALIGVGKTTNTAGVELESLGKQIQNISRTLPIAATELLGIAQAAGQLGVTGTADIARFTETVGKLSLASDLAGENAATSLARILTVTGTSISEVDRLGSTIVQLGNNFAATESEIAGMTTRVSQATVAFGVSAAEAVGMSAALKAVGIQAENGGTQVGMAFRAINDALRQGGAEMEALQKITGETRDALSVDFFGGAATQTFVKFIEGLGRIQAAGGDVGAALADMKLSGERSAAVLATIATRSETLSSALDMANQEWKTNTALTIEAMTASKSFSAQMGIAGNIIDEVMSIVGRQMAPAILSITNGFREWVIEAEKTGKIESVARSIGDAMAFTADAVGTLIDAAKILAPVIAVRIVAAFIAARIEAIRYQSALAAMAGLSTTAAIKITAMGAAARIASGAMALLGGPLGVITLAATAVFAFREELGLVSKTAADAQHGLDRLTASIEGMTSAQAQFQLLGVTDDYQSAIQEVNNLSGSVAMLQDRLTAQPTNDFVREALLGQASALDDAKQKADVYASAMERLNSVINKTRFAGADGPEPLPVGIVTPGAAGAAGAANDNSKFKDALDKIKDATRAAALETKILNENLSEVDAKVLKAAESAGLLGANFKVIANASADVNDLTKAYGKLGTAQDAANKKAEDSAAKLQNIKNATDEVGGAFESAFSSAIIEGGKLSDVFKNLANDILNMMLQSAIVKPLAGAASSALGPLLGGLFSFAGGGTTGNGPRTGGVDGQGGFPAILHPKETVVDHTKGQSMGGGDVTVNVYAPPGSTVEQRDATGPGGRTIDIMIDEAVANNIGRPGSRTGRALSNRFSNITPQLASR